MKTLTPAVRRAFLTASSGMLLTGCTTMGGCNSAAFQSKATQTVTVKAEKAFTLTNSVGDVKIVADPSATSVRCEAVKIGKGSSPAKADEALAEIKLTTTDGPADDDAGARAEQPSGGGGWSGKQWEVQWTITAPPGTRIVVKDGVGDVTVSGFVAGADVKSGVGDVSVEARGPVKAHSDVGDVKVVVAGEEAAGVEAVSDVGDVSVTVPLSWRGRVNLDSSVGDVSSNVAGLSGSGRHQATGGSVSGTVGGGDSTGPQLKARANVGNVTLRHGGA